MPPLPPQIPPGPPPLVLTRPEALAFASGVLRYPWASAVVLFPPPGCRGGAHDAGPGGPGALPLPPPMVSSPIAVCTRLTMMP